MPDAGEWRIAKPRTVEFIAETYVGLSDGLSYDEEVMRLYSEFKGPTP